MVSLRWSDMLLLGGVLLLFVFTPSVLAGGLGGPEAVDGADFSLPAPKEGEVLVYALKVQVDGRVVFEDRRGMTVVFGDIGPVTDGHGREREAMDMTVSFTSRLPTADGPEVAPGLTLVRLMGRGGDHVVAEIDSQRGMSLLERSILQTEEWDLHRVEYEEDDLWRESGTPFMAGFRLGQEMKYRRDPVSKELNELTAGVMEVLFELPHDRPLTLDRVATRGDTLVFGHGMRDLNVRYGNHLTLDVVARWNHPLFGLHYEDEAWEILTQEKNGWWSPDVPLFVQTQADAVLKNGATEREVRMTLELVGREVPEHARPLPIEFTRLPEVTVPEPIEWTSVLDERLHFEDPRFPYREALRAIEGRASPLREKALASYDEARVVAVSFAHEGTVELPTEAQEAVGLSPRLPGPTRTADPLAPRMGENLTWWIVEGPRSWPSGKDLPGSFFVTAVSRIVDPQGRPHEETVYDLDDAEVGEFKVGRIQFTYGGSPNAIRTIAPLDHLETRARETAASQGHDLRPDAWTVGDAYALDSAIPGLWRWDGGESLYLVRERSAGDPRETRHVQLDGGSGQAVSYHESGATTNAPVTKTPSARSVHVAQGEVELIPVTATAAAGAGAGLLLVLAGLFARFGALLKHGVGVGLLVPLYAKIMKSEVLDNARRERVMEALRVEPGLSASEIKRRLGYGWGTVVHHLETLRRNGLASSVREGHRLRWFVTDVTDPAAERNNALLANPRLKAFVTAVEKDPGADLRALSEQLGLGRSITSDYGRRLEQAGLVRKERHGRSVRFYRAG